MLLNNEWVNNEIKEEIKRYLDCKWMLGFIKCFSASIDMIMWFLSFILFMWCIAFIDLWMLYQPCIPGINPTWSWCMIFLMHCCIWFANILLRISASMFIRDIGLYFSFFVVSLSDFGIRWIWEIIMNLGNFPPLEF